MVHCCIRKDNTSKQWFFLFSSTHEARTYQAFSPFSLLQMLNDCWMSDVEFFGNFLCSCERISFDVRSQLLLSTCNGWPLHCSSSRLLSPLQNFLNDHCIVRSLAVPVPNALLMLQVVSAALWPILSSNKITAQICFLSSIIFIL